MENWNTGMMEWRKLERPEEIKTSSGLFFKSEMGMYSRFKPKHFDKNSIPITTSHMT
jgi:hypothetical protein